MADVGQRDLDRPAEAENMAHDGNEDAAQPPASGPALEFPRQVLMFICNYASCGDLKLFRLVSRDWNHVVSSHPKYVETPVKFSKGWQHKAEEMDKCSLTKWRNIKLRYFNYPKQDFFRIYWQHVKGTVHTLKLEYLIIGCMDLANLINSCTSLQTLVLRAVDIIPIHERTVEVRNANQHGELGDLRSYTQVMYCNHTSFSLTTPTTCWPSNAPETFGKPTITSLKVCEHASLPLCVLQVLRLRCRLTTFKFEVCPLKPDVIMSPDTDTTADQLARILEDCQATLKSFSFIHNKAGENLLRVMGEPGRFNEGLALREFNVQIEPVNFRQRGGRVIPRISTSVLGILRKQQRTKELTSVSIGMIMDRNFLETLLPILQGTASLRKLSVTFYVRTDHNNMLPLHRLLPNLAQVEDLTIEDGEMLNATDLPEWQFRSNLDYAFLNNMPVGLRSLALVHFWPRQEAGHLQALVQHANLRNLRKFEIQECGEFNDNMMRLVILNMAQLEELNIVKAVRLTDFGTTGLDPDTCVALSACAGHNLMSQSNVNGNRVFLARLRNLKRISFQGCIKLTDITIRFGFIFPHLESLDMSDCVNVSDIGLSWLSQATPALELLTLRHVHRISHLGLNLLVGAHSNIKRIYVSETSAKRRTGHHTYVEHPCFRDIVDWTRIRKTPDEHKRDRRYRHYHRRWHHW